MQRGKFSHNDGNSKAGAAEVLNMIQHGAQEIILTCDQEDDEDMKANIDKIIDKSLKKTEEIEK